MKNRLQSYTSFSSKEKAGLAVLLVLLLLLAGVKAMMHLWVVPDIEKEKEQKLQQAWNDYKRTEIVHLEPLPDVIDLNTADSATLVRLKGIGPATAHNIIALRTSDGPFTDVNQIRDAGRFSDSSFAYLSQHLSVSADK